MDKLLETLNNFLNAAGATISQHAPQVWEATQRLVFWNALLALLGNLFIVTVLVVVWAWPWRKWFAYTKENEWDDNGYTFSFIAVSICLGVVTPIIYFSLSWTYYIICVIDPRLGILYSLAAKAGII